SRGDKDPLAGPPGPAPLPRAAAPADGAPDHRPPAGLPRSWWAGEAEAPPAELPLPNRHPAPRPALAGRAGAASPRRWHTRRVPSLDYAASAPLRPEALAAMLPFLEQPVANPSSQHGPGRAARSAVETARAQVAALVGAAPSQVVFTSGGPEADNLAVKGTVLPR